MIRTGAHQGITAGLRPAHLPLRPGARGADATNDLTFAMLEVIDEMSPILEPKPNMRLHTGSPDELAGQRRGHDRASQGAPFLLNFDERSADGHAPGGRVGQARAA